MNHVFARLVGMTFVLGATTASPAFAATELGLSLDGVHWTQSISDPLFDQSMRWVPGDSETATFFVRNQGGTPGGLTVDVLGSQASDLLDSGDLQIMARGGGGTWVVVSTSGTHRLLTAPSIPDGEVVPIYVSVAFDPSSFNQTQLRTATLKFRVTMAESIPTAPGGNGGSELPGTGAPELGWMGPLGAMLTGMGLALVSRRREQDKVEQNV